MNRITSAIEAVHMDDLHSTESQFRAAHPWCWQFTLVGPFALTGVLLAFLVFQTGWEFTTKIATAAVMTVVFFGRFIILSGTDGGFEDTNGSLAAEHLLAIVCYLDVMTALVLAFHIGFLFRLPYIGPRVSALVTDGHFILDSQPWMRRATFFGLIAFVGFPLAATGSIGGSIFGRLLGMSRTATFFGIVIGALLGNTVMFLFSDLLSNYIDKDNIYLKIGGFLAIAAVIFVLERRYRRLKEGFAKGKLPIDQPHVDYGIPGDDHVINPIDHHHSPTIHPPAEPLESPTLLHPKLSHHDGATDHVKGLVEDDDTYETVSGNRSGSRPHPR